MKKIGQVDIMVKEVYGNAVFYVNLINDYRRIKSTWAL